MLGLNDAGEDAPKSLRRAYAYGVFLGGVRGASVLSWPRYKRRDTASPHAHRLMAVSGAGYAFLALIGAWLLFDLILLPAMVRRANHRDAPIGPCPITRDSNRAWH